MRGPDAVVPIDAPRLRRMARMAAASCASPANPASAVVPDRGVSGSAEDMAAAVQAAPGRTGARGSAPPEPAERCDLCAMPVPAEHRHLLDLRSRRLRCACRACALLFDRREAGGGSYRLVPDRVLHVEDLELDDARWAGLRIPVGLAFFFRGSPDGRVAAFYPGPMGATEAPVDPVAWAALEAANPVLVAVEPEVEALLVNRARGERSYWIAPVDACYRLAGLIRVGWRGLGGGEAVWAAIDRYFDDLRRRSRRVDRAGAAR